MSNNKTGKKGVVFIVVLGVLVLLVLLGVTFSLLSRLDVSGARSYADRIHAKMIAQSGIETAMAKLKSNTAQLSQESIYYGEDANKNGKLDADEDQNKNGQLDVGDCPLEYALRPSFAKVNADDKPELTQFKNRKRGSSGELPSVLGGGTTDSYALKVIDCNSLIYINGEGKGTEQFLNNLGLVLDAGTDLGTKIVKAREAMSTKRFSAKEELKSTLGDDTYQKVTPYLTVYAYVNEQVIKPKPLEDRPCRTVEGGRRQLNADSESNVYTWASLNPGKLDLEPRAPININVASKPVLMAALGDLKGFYLWEKDVSSESLGSYAPDYAHKDTDGSHINKYKTDGDPNVDDTLARMGQIESASIEIKALGQNSMAEQIADKILEERSKSPFLSWEDFDKFLNTLKRDGILGNEDKDKPQARLDIIRANANPNTLLNDFNPNIITWRYVDKSDLMTYTTEFCLQPMGYFEIESQGIVSIAAPATSGDSVPTDSPRKVLSDYRIKCLVNLWQNEYQTTQKDFADGTISNSQSTTTATHNNKTLQLYPEPDISDYAKKCEADGQIYLATIQDAYQSKQVRLKLSFDKDLKANNYRGSPNIVSEHTSSDAYGRPDGNDLQRPSTKSIFDETREGPGTLYPDGAYSEWGATPSYDATRGNFVDYTAETGDQLKQRFRGTVSFWLKRNYEPKSTKPRIIFSATRYHIEHPEDGDWTQNLSTFALFVFPSNYPRWGRHFWTQLDPSNPQQAKDRSEWETYLKSEEPRGSFVWFWEIDEDPFRAPPLPPLPDEYLITHDQVVTTGATESALNSRNQWMHITMSWDSDPTIKGTGTFSVRDCTSCGGSGTKSQPCPTCTGKGSVSAGSTESSCGSCKGKGVTSGTRPVTCVVCGGNGRSGPPTTSQQEVVCPACKGQRTVTQTTEKTEPCGQCNGKGKKQEQKGCPGCGGSGRTVTWTRYGPQRRPCNQCGGGGKVKVDVPCPGCNGKGNKVTETQSSTVQCPSCNGKGSAIRTVITPAPPCDTCKGTGSSGTQQYTGSCGSCGGDGKITTPQSQGCPQCGGDGKQKDSQGKVITTPDSSCDGSGKVKGPEVVEDRNAADVFGLYINGQDYRSRDICSKNATTPPPIPQKYPDFADGYNLVRLGERYGAQIWNYSADSTIDEFTIQQHDDVKNIAKEFALTEYQNGRYYKGKGEFTSGTLQVPTPAGNPSSMRASASWTVYYPSGWDTTQSSVEVQFFDESDNPISEVLSDPKGSEFEIPLNSTKGYATKIKYKLYFQKSTADDNTPLLESPIFDDINIKFIYPEPVILKWALD